MCPADVACLRVAAIGLHLHVCIADVPCFSCVGFNKVQTPLAPNTPCSRASGVCAVPTLPTRGANLLDLYIWAFDYLLSPCYRLQDGSSMPRIKASGMCTLATFQPSKHELQTC